jgi:poly-gamma-glutamate capsule biosynthesis protein CapA/YwtB (metallophosphatase superfamily)
MYLHHVSVRRVAAMALFVLVCLVGWLGRDAFAQRPRALVRSTGLSQLPVMVPVMVPVSSAKPASPAKPKRIRAAFTGDVAITLGVGVVVSSHREPNFPFADVAERLREYDLLVGNLECVVATRGQPTIREPLVAPPETPQLLRDAGFDLVSIANNHTLDMSNAGYFEMLEKLNSAGIVHFGSTAADHARDPIVIREIEGIRVALIGHMNREEKRAIEDISRARASADIVIVFEHWGIEYAQYPVRYQRLLGRTLIDAGADAVIGAHAHVVQPIEIYKNRLIAHGLGNFVFSSMVRRGTRTGAVLELDLEKTGIVGRRFRSVTIDDRGAPHWNGEATDEPVFDPPGPRILTTL